MPSFRRTNTCDELMIAMHMGCSSQHVGLVSMDGGIKVANVQENALAERADLTYPELVRTLTEAVEAVIEDCRSRGIGTDEIVGASLIVPAPVDVPKGYVVMAPSLKHLHDAYPARDIEVKIHRLLGRQLPVVLENDANGVCLAERYFGHGRDCRNFVIITLCTGLGGAMMIGDGLYRGANHMALEVGHTTVQPVGRLCPCGNRGCLDTLVSGKALLRQARTCYPPFRERTRLSYEDVIAAADEGIPEILDLFKSFGQYLGIGLASILNVLNPYKVVLCGCLSKAHRFFLEEAMQEQRNRSFIGIATEVVLTDLTDNMELLAALGAYIHYSGKEHDNG
jgi:predicted NBD/HSP70 family sugar kinase